MIQNSFRDELISPLFQLYENTPYQSKKEQGFESRFHNPESCVPSKKLKNISSKKY